VSFIVPKARARSRGRRAPVHPGRRAVALLAAVAAVLTSLAAPPAAAAPTAPGAATSTTAAPATAFNGPAAAPQLSAQDQAVMMEQEPYMALDEQVRQTASAQASSPLAGTRIDTENRTLHVHWVGAAPAELRSIQESATRQGITVKIVPAAFSEQTLMAATNDVSTVAESTQAELTVTIHNDGTGLTVHQDGLLEASQGRTPPTQAQSQVLDAVSAIRSKSGIPITLADLGPERSMPADRHNDSTPYWSGAVTKAAGLMCTSGFSMYATGSPTTRFMMTAAHCSGFRDGAVATNGVDARMGVTDFIHEMYDLSPHYDLGVIRLDAGKSNEGKVFSGSTTANPFLVKGVARGIPAGGRYCVSRTTTGSYHCNLLSDNQVAHCGRWLVPLGRCIYVIEWHSAGGNIYCQGDSGGPVFYMTSGGIIAAGIVSFGYGSGPCFSGRGGISVVAAGAGKISGLAVRLS
jgi:trypsin